MININRILAKDRLLRAMTGLNRKAFEVLLEKFEKVYEQEEEKTGAMPRQRRKGGGRKARLESMAEKLFYILFYLKCYPTFDLASALFDFDRSQAHRWVHKLQRILEKALGEKQVLPLRQINSVEEFLEKFPMVKKVIVDGTERAICRPKDEEKQRENYSGKKKRHTRKNVVASDKEKKILVLTVTKKGKIHDKKIQEEEDFILGIPDEIDVLADSGFQGLQKQYENIHLPKKKPRGGELTKEEKAKNKELAKERVVVENAIGGVKRYNAVSGIYRNRICNFDDKLMLTACGLWNFYLEAA